MGKKKKLTTKPKGFFLFSWVHRAFRKFILPIPPGLWFTNFIFQKILRINSEQPWSVHYTSRASGTITIGENVWRSFAVSGGCYIQGANGVEIDDETIFAPNVQMISSNHDMDNGGWIKGEPIRIGKHCWIGGGAIILPEVTLGDHCIVAAGAVVSKSFPRGSVVAGVPAKLIKTRDLPDEDSEA